LNQESVPDVAILKEYIRYEQRVFFHVPIINLCVFAVKTLFPKFFGVYLQPPETGRQGSNLHSVAAAMAANRL
jgi:hypothetical protein